LGSFLRHLPLALSACIFAAQVLHFFNYVDDDAFIPMRYALNFWRGQGWVMNPGERVEGYTSPLQLWYLTVLLRFFTPDTTVIISKCLGIALGISVLDKTRRLGRLLYPSEPWIGDVAMVLLALRLEFALSMTNVLETGLATWLLIGGIYATLQTVGGAGGAAEAKGEGGARRPGRTALWFVGAALARPELTVILPALTLARWKSLSVGYRRVVLSCYLGALLCGLLCRLVYYRDALPNTFYAKHMPLGLAVPQGWDYLMRYAMPLQSPAENVIVCLAGISGFVLLGRCRRDLATVLALIVVFVLCSGGTWSIDGRFVTPVLPIVACTLWIGPLTLIAYFLEKAGGKDGRRHRSLRGDEALVLSACVVVYVAICDAAPRVNKAAARPSLHDVAFVCDPPAANRIALGRWQSGMPDGRRRIADWIAAHARPGQTVAQTEMGVVALLNMDVRFIDLRGLTDYRVARMTAHPHYNIGVDSTDWADPGGQLWPYLLERKPDWIALFDTPTPASSAAVVNGTYSRVGAFDIVADGGEVWNVRTWRRIDAEPPPGR
jgi:hypothetical protein